MQSKAINKTFLTVNRPSDTDSDICKLDPKFC